MFPDNVPSSQVVKAPYSGARAMAVSATVDYEDGGIAVQDPSKGLLYQRWRARVLDKTTVVVDSRTVPAFTLLEGSDITEISLTWDQNMRPALAFVEGGRAKLQWYDSLAGEQVITELDVDVVSPKVCMDDKRILQTGISDIILAYKRGNNLYWRTQRERFLTERLWAENVPPGPLVKIGFNRQLRMQAQVAL